MTDFQYLARGIALAGCGIGAGCALIAVSAPVSAKATLLPLPVRPLAVSRSARATLPAP